MTTTPRPASLVPGDQAIRTPRQSRISIRTREAIECYLFILPAVLGLLIFYIGPMIASFVLSLTDYDLLRPPEFVGLDNYREMAEDDLFWKSLRVTAIYSTVSVPLVMALGLFLAVLLNQKVRGTTFFRSVFYLPTVISGVAVAMLWRWIFNDEYGILNLLLDKVGIRGPGWLIDDQWALTALIMTSVWTAGGTMLIFLAGLQAIPAELYEAAELDGASRWRRFWTVTFPMLSNVTFFNLVLGIIGALQVFTEAFVLTNGGPNNSTLLLPVYLYRQAFQYLEMGYASAVAWVMFLIVFVLTLIVFRSAPLWVHYQSEGDDR